MKAFKINLNNSVYDCREYETLLDALLRQGVNLSFSCRKGSCQVCMLQCTDGHIPSVAQDNLRPTFKTNRYFLPCQCIPTGNLNIREIDHQILYTTAYVHKKNIISANVCQLFIESDKLTDFRAGQFINLSRPSDGESRSYSIASTNNDDGIIELHIQRMKNGTISNWIFDELEVNDEIEIQGPNGKCCYQPNNINTSIIMVATGTGMAPVLGILRDAIRNKHTGNIDIYHEVAEKGDHYLNNVMNEIQLTHKNIRYLPCIPTYKKIPTVINGSAQQLINSSYSDLSKHTIYLAGSSRMVSEITECVLAKGTAIQNIYSDSFEFKDLRLNNRKSQKAQNTPEPIKQDTNNIPYPPPDPELWLALGNGTKLTAILNDFYTIVYSDKRLSPFFHNTTMQRSVEKVYLFLRQIFTGEKIYIGDRPRNAHHWMVISDEIFDYRRSIMQDCLRRHELPEQLVERWLAIEESFRPDIVKDKPWNKIVNGVEIPSEGFEELVLDTGTLCDSCHQPVESGVLVRYHVRTGSLYCPACMTSQ
jgi:NAD(P)H-flavin reductase/ferredoxin/truncated hemoglobin YjbI